MFPGGLIIPVHLESQVPVQSGNLTGLSRFVCNVHQMVRTLADCRRSIWNCVGYQYRNKICWNPLELYFISIIGTPQSSHNWTTTAPKDKMGSFSLKIKHLWYCTSLCSLQILQSHWALFWLPAVSIPHLVHTFCNTNMHMYRTGQTNTQPDNYCKIRLHYYKKCA